MVLRGELPEPRIELGVADLLVLGLAGGLEVAHPLARLALHRLRPTPQRLADDEDDRAQSDHHRDDREDLHPVRPTGRALARARARARARSRRAPARRGPRSPPGPGDAPGRPWATA